MTPARAPLRLRPFRRLLATYAVNGLGDWIGEIALATLVYAATGSALATAALWLVQHCLPGLAAPVLVARLEAVPTARLLPALHIVQAAVFAVLALLVATDALALWLIAPLVVVDGLCGPVARAFARTAVVAVTRPAGLHREGNALLNVACTVNCAAGPALGGALVLLLGPQTALLADAVTFAIAAALLGLRAGLPSSPVEPEPALARLREGLAYVRDRPLLRSMLAGEAAAAVLFSAILPIEIVFVIDTLGSDEAGYGLMLAAWGSGMVAGGALAARLPDLPLPRLLALSAVALAVSHLGMGLSPSVAAAATWAAFGGIGNGIYSLVFITALQERTTDAFQARVNGLYEGMQTCMGGAGFVLGGLLATVAGTRAVYLLAGTGALLTLLWAVARTHDLDWRVAAGPKLAASGS